MSLLGCSTHGHLWDSPAETGALLEKGWLLFPVGKLGLELATVFFRLGFVALGFEGGDEFREGERFENLVLSVTSQ